MTSISYLSILFIILVNKISVRYADNCGLQKINIQELIFHGSTAYAGQFPWHVAVYHKELNKEPEYRCGGSLISERFVLTAAHCTYLEWKQSILIRVGLHDLNKLKSSRIQKLPVKEIHNVAGKTWQNLRNDIAILELDVNVTFNKYVQPICINRHEEMIGTNGVIAGWGMAEEGIHSTALRYTKMPIIASMDCLASNPGGFSMLLDSGLLCAGHVNGIGICLGDSGGGLYINRGGVWYLTGIIASSAGGDEGSGLCSGYATFTKVFKYLPWISSVTGMQLPAALKPGYRPMDGELPPWFGGIFTKIESNYQYVRSVSIISEQYVLTSAENIFFMIMLMLSRPVIKVGPLGVDHTDNFAQEHSIDSISSESALIVIKLNTSIEFVTNVLEPIALWNEQIASNPAVVHQFGYMVVANVVDDRERYSLQEAQISARPSEFCSLTSFNKTEYFCGSHKNTLSSGLTTADYKGSGLYWNFDGQWYLRGIFFVEDNSNSTDIPFKIILFMDVGFSRNWIQNQTGIN